MLVNLSPVASLLRKSWPLALLVVILALALALRLRGVDWDSGHGFHPDEPESAAALLSSEPVGEGVRHIADVYGAIVADARRHRLEAGHRA